jgi:transcriptional regulator MraZ
MFRGNHPTRADEKGRLKVPAEFKREIEERYGSNRFYVTSRSGQTAEVYPMEEWEKIEQVALKTPTSNPSLKKFLEITSYFGQVVEMDGQGRLLLPAILREKANLKGDVAVVGMARYLVVRNMEAFTKQIEENPYSDDDAQALSELGI